MEAKAFAVLGSMGAIDREQLLAFQYSKIVRAGDLAMDVGAHTGLHTARLLRLVGPRGAVVAAEPIASVFDRFLVPLLGADPRCELFRGALAEHQGNAPFFVVTGSEQESGLRLKSAFAQPTSLAPVRTEVALSTIDALAAGRRVSFLKIDVEGAEHRVLVGARATLERSRPVVALETGASIRDHGSTPEELHRLLDRLGYEITGLLGAPLSREQFLAAVESGAMWDFLLLPRERGAELRDALEAPDSPYLEDRCVDLRATSPGPHARGLVGFSSVENWGRWTDARLCPTAYVQLARPVSNEIVVEVVCLAPTDKGARFVVGVAGEEEELVANGHPAARSVTFKGVAGGEVVWIRPLRVVRGRGADPRWVGVGVQSVRVRP